jgi:L-threonylcarbamoyladenylate synthase
MRHRHYAPRASVELTAPDQAAERVRELCARGCRVGWLTFGPAGAGPVATMPMPREPVGYARDLYAVLHHLDNLGVERIVIELPPDSEPWLAIHDRLRRAAASG